jgi:hypothetical protein
LKFLPARVLVPNVGTESGEIEHRMRRGVRALGLAASAALLLGCELAVSTPAAEADPAPDQHARAEVLEAFLADPKAAAGKYREVWEERSVSDAGDFTLLAIAQGMVQNRQGDPTEYLRFARHKTRAKDVNVVEAALWVYSGANDEESLDALFGFLPDQRGTASMAAESVIAYRRALAKSDPAHQEDGVRIAARLEEWCAEPKHQVRPICH